MRKRKFLAVPLACFALVSLGQISLYKNYGGLNEGTRKGIVTSDGGIAMVGYSYTFGSGLSDAYVIKTDSLGVLQWTKTYGSSQYYDEGSVVEQTANGGFIIGASTINGYVVIRTNENGVVQWVKRVTGKCSGLREDTNGDFIVAGTTNGIGSGGNDLYVSRLSSTGNFLWGRAYGGDQADEFFDIDILGDGGFVLAGFTKSFGIVNGFSDAYLIAINATGDVLWNKTYGSEADDKIRSIARTMDGGFILAGNTRGFGSLSSKYFLLKVNAIGEVEWSRVFGDEYPECVTQTSDEGFVVAGYKNGYDGRVTKFSNLGAFEWSKSYTHVPMGIGQSLNGDLLLPGYYAQRFTLMRTSEDGYAGCNEMDELMSPLEATFEVNTPSSLVVSGGFALPTTVLQGLGGLANTVCYSAETNVYSATNRLDLLQASPNPASSLLRIEVKGFNGGNCTLSLYDCRGVQLINQISMVGGTAIINTRDYSRGLYTVSVYSNGTLVGTSRVVFE